LGATHEQEEGSSHSWTIWVDLHPCFPRKWRKEKHEEGGETGGGGRNSGENRALSDDANGGED